MYCHFNDAFFMWIKLTLDFQINIHKAFDMVLLHQERERNQNMLKLIYRKEKNMAI